MPGRLMSFKPPNLSAGLPLIVVFSTLLPGFPPLHADIIHVPDDYETIREAVGQTEQGDTVLVEAGTYNERIDFAGRQITLASAFIFTGDPDDIANTIINGGGGGRVITFQEEEAEETVLVGFTVTGGVSLYGGGIYINGASPTLKFLLIYGNRAHRVEDRGGYGGGLYLTHRSNPTLTNLTVADNIADESNGGLHTFDESDAAIVNCIFWDNDQNSLPDDLDVRYSCIEGGYAGNGNLDGDDDPLFVDPPDDDYRIEPDSPCIDRGDPDSPDDADGTRADMGALYFESVPRIGVDSRVLDFAEIIERSVRTLILDISNDGLETLVLDSVSIEPADSPFSTAEWEASPELEPEEDYELTVTFAPEDTGTFEATLNIFSNDPDMAVLEVTLNGDALPALPGIAIRPAALGFGRVGLRTATERRLTISNTGHDTLIVDSATIRGDDSLEFHARINDPVEIPPEEDYDLTVTLFPFTLGAKSARLIISSNDPENPVIEANLFALAIMPEPHFEFAFNTGVDHSILVLDADIDGRELTMGDEIGIFTPDGLCCGGEFWQGERTGITAWGDDEMTEELDGFNERELISFRIWDIETELEAPAQPEFIDGDERFRSRGISVVELSGFTRSDFALHLDEGWTMISAPTIPDETVITRMWQPLVESETLILLKDYTGNFFFPERDFNNIPDWEQIQGYQIRMSEVDTLLIEGFTAPPNTPIEMQPGWFIVAYFPQQRTDARIAFRSIVDELIIAKDGYGGFYFPEEDFNTMAPLMQGQGYQVSLDHEATLVWNIDDRMNAMDYESGNQVSHFQAQSMTGANMSLIITGLTDYHDVDEIGVFTSAGLCVGAVAIDGGPPWGLPVWGDDITTPRVDGAVDGEPLHFKVWQKEFESDMNALWARSGPDYFTDDVGMVSLIDKSDIPTEITLYEPYPNPFNGVVELSFFIPLTSDVSLNVYDLAGREIASLTDGELRPGIHRFVWDSAGFSSGVYIARLTSPTKVSTTKLMLLK